MVWSTIPISCRVEVRSPDTNRNSHPVAMRLHGHWDDVKAVVDHWRIEVEWKQAVSRVRDECAVDGVLSVGD